MASDDERRLHERYRAWLPAQIGGESVEMQLAIGHDMSQGGALLVTRTELEVGAAITLEIQVPPGEGEVHQLTGKVLRSQPNEADPEGLWPFQIAVAFDKAMPELEEALEDHLDKLAAAGQPNPAAPEEGAEDEEP